MTRTLIGLMLLVASLIVVPGASLSTRDTLDADPFVEGNLFPDRPPSIASPHDPSVARR